MKRETIYHLLWIICLGTIAYSNSLFNGFVFDDNVLIVNNENIKHFHYIPKFFSGEFFDIDMRFHKGGYYRPLILLSFLVDFVIWRLNPFGFHLTNLLLHLSNALLVYALLLEIFTLPRLSLITAILFLIHPVQTSAVSYISGRTDVLALCFMLIFLWSGVKLFKKEKWCLSDPWLYCFFVFYLGGLLCKETAIVVSVILLGYLFAFKGIFFLRLNCKRLVVLFVPLFIVTCGYLLVRALVLHSFSGGSGSIFLETLLVRLLLLPKIILNYVFILCYPFDLHFERFIVLPQSVLTYLSYFSAWGYLICFLLLSYFFYKSYKKEKIVFFAITFFLIALSPGMQLIPIMVNGKLFTPEHFLYIPSIGFFLLIAFWLQQLLASRYKKVAFVLLFSCLVLFSLLTIKRNFLFKNNFTFYQNTLQSSPNSARVHNNLGNAYSDQGDFDKALAEYNMALKLDPSYVKTYLNIGDLYTKRGLYASAQEHYLKALKITPYDYVLLANIGVNFDKQKKYTQAVDFLKKSIDIKPTHKESYDNLGTVYANAGLFEEAMQYYTQAVQLDARFAKAHYHIGNLLMQEQKYKQAIAKFQTALSYQKDLLGAYNNLGIAYQRTGDLDASMEIYKKAIKIAPNDLSLHNNLGATYLTKGLFDLALAEFKLVAHILPKDLMARYNIGSVFLRKKEYAEAKAAFLAARSLDEKDIDTALALSFSYQSLGENKEALIELKRIAGLYPNNKDIKQYLQNLQKIRP